MSIGAQLSDLTSLPYDFVVGTTQLAINKAMLNYVQETTFPTVQVCWASNDAGVPVLGDCATLLSDSGVDFFSFANTTISPSNPAFGELVAANFYGAVEVEIGIPGGVDVSTLPDIINLDGGERDVGFQMYCKEFHVIWFSANIKNLGYTSAVQGPQFPWVYNATVNLDLQSTAQNSFGNLPPAVKAQVNNLQASGAAFSVQQLLFDLSTPGLAGSANLIGLGIAPGTTIYELLNQDFLPAYMAAMEAAQSPVLGFAVVPANGPASTLTMTGFNFEVMPYLDSNGGTVVNPSLIERELYSLNYVCVTGGRAVPPNTPLKWNWVDQSQLANGQTPPDGAIAIARNQFAATIEGQLTSVATQMSMLPSTTVNFVASEAAWVFTYQLTTGQTPTVVAPASTTGATVMSFTHSDSSSDIAGASGAPSAKTGLNTNYNMTVEFSGAAVTITQHMVVFMLCEALGTSASGNIYDKTYVDTYALSANGGPQLVVTHTTSFHDDSVVPSVNPVLNAFLDVNGVINNIDAAVTPWLNNIFLDDLPVNLVQNFIFPGGNTFNFTGVVFSQHQDLVASINYII
ncbi:hypothetical protein GGX14DRAFT_407681 [Mycena pura]|uniref:Uncharacterized protein n=1 Tax=Mycena pura TaxID=153505 RepID=A0AAD6UMI6_9AGAR|nr:hypothetical protein GGX14DRAFT_407681 [Mycena pura]